MNNRNKFYCILTTTSLPKLQQVHSLRLPEPVVIPIHDLKQSLHMNTYDFKEKFKINKPDNTTELYFRCMHGMTAEKAVYMGKSMGYNHCFNLNRIILEKKL